ncbi:MAG: SufB/SufD family protein, partial [Candidatus Methanomethylophilaceae archaeon]
EVGSRDADRIEDLGKADETTKDLMVNVGVVADESGRDGSIIFIDNGMSHCSNRTEDGVELMSTRDAVAKYDWLKDYFWKAMDPEKDKFTAKTYLEDSDGYFIRVKKGYHAKNPVQTCMLLKNRNTMQNLHNIIIVEEDASLEIITGCTTDRHANNALHIGVSEIYVKDGGSLSFSMIHNWGSDTVVRPRTACILGKDAKYVNNYVILNPVGTLQSFPVTYLNGEGASCKYNTICLAHKDSNIDTGGAVIMNAPYTSAEIMSRSLNKGGKMIARGRLSGNAEKVKAHLECRSIVLEDGGLTLAVPELESTVADVEMTHEAAVGKIDRDQIEYLMSRGLTEDDAVSMIVRGFLVGGIKGLPENLKREIDDAVEKANLGN